mmetsp:Transcript_2828/g.7069  ORF Transcript_2828/g.7069 Transcript_2828/m.7069 type:complete len:249 (+) Transcript_2828:654-1400(+)
MRGQHDAVRRHLRPHRGRARQAIRLEDLGRERRLQRRPRRPSLHHCGLLLRLPMGGLAHRLPWRLRLLRRVPLRTLRPQGGRPARRLRRPRRVRLLGLPRHRPARRAGLRLPRHARRRLQGGRRRRPLLRRGLPDRGHRGHAHRGDRVGRRHVARALRRPEVRRAAPRQLRERGPRAGRFQARWRRLRDQRLQQRRLQARRLRLLREQLHPRRGEPRPLQARWHTLLAHQPAAAREHGTSRRLAQYGR